MKITLILGMLLFQSLLAQDTFNLETVRINQENINLSLKTHPAAIAWKEAQDSIVKQNKFNLLIQEIAGPVLARQWSYPGGGQWPLIDWSKVTSLATLIDDQRSILETTHAIAQTDVELAQVCVLGESILGLGAEAEPWYEDWVLSLATSSNQNLKRLSFFMTSGFAEEIEKSGPAETVRAIDWNTWESSFNQSDNLGKALLLVCMTDLASRLEDYAKVTEIHLGVYNGTNDDLKALALYTGSRKLGEAVVAKWQDLADNHPNAKMKTLALEALER